MPNVNHNSTIYICIYFIFALLCFPVAQSTTVIDYTKNNVSDAILYDTIRPTALADTIILEQPKTRFDLITASTFLTSSPTLTLTFTIVSSCLTRPNEMFTVLLTLVDSSLSSSRGQTVYSLPSQTWSTLLDSTTFCAIEKLEATTVNSTQTFSNPGTVWVPPFPFIWKPFWSFSDSHAISGVLPSMNDIQSSITLSGSTLPSYATIEIYFFGWAPSSTINVSIEITLKPPSSNYITCNPLTSQANSLGYISSDEAAKMTGSLATITVLLVSSVRLSLKDIAMACTLDDSTHNTGWFYYQPLSNVSFSISYIFPDSTNNDQYQYSIYNTPVLSSNVFSTRLDFPFSTQFNISSIFTPVLDGHKYIQLPSKLPLPIIGNTISVTLTSSYTLDLVCSVVVVLYTVVDNLVSTQQISVFVEQPISITTMDPSTSLYTTTFSGYDNFSLNNFLYSPDYKINQGPIGVNYLSIEVASCRDNSNIAIRYYQDQYDHSIDPAQRAEMYPTQGLAWMTLSNTGTLQAPIITLTLYSVTLQNNRQVNITISGSVRSTLLLEYIPFSFQQVYNIFPYDDKNERYATQTISFTRDVFIGYILANLNRDGSSIITDIINIRADGVVVGALETRQTGLLTLCRDGYTGPTCRQPVECQELYDKLNQCSTDRGIIQSLSSTCNTTCTCDSGWTGDDCSLAVITTPCPVSCDDTTAVCSLDSNECVCRNTQQDGWYPVQPSDQSPVTTCQRECPCQNNGTCVWDPTLTCTCPKDKFTGLLCQTPVTQSQCTARTFLPSICDKGYVHCDDDTGNISQCSCSSPIWRNDLTKIDKNGIGTYCSLCYLADAETSDTIRCSHLGTHRVSYATSRCINGKCICKRGYTGSLCQYNAAYGNIIFIPSLSSTIIDPIIYKNTILSYIHTYVIGTIPQLDHDNILRYIDIYNITILSEPAQSLVPRPIIPDVNINPVEVLPLSSSSSVSSSLSLSSSSPSNVLSTNRSIMPVLSSEWYCIGGQQPVVLSSSPNNVVCITGYQYTIIINRDLIAYDISTSKASLHNNDNHKYNNNDDYKDEIINFISTDTTSISNLDSLYTAWDDSITNMSKNDPNITAQLGDPTASSGHIYDQEYCNSLISQGIQENDLPPSCQQNIQYKDDAYDKEADQDDDIFGTDPVIPGKPADIDTKKSTIGIILGIIAAFIVCFVALLVLLCCLKKKQKGCFAQRQKKNKGPSNNTNNTNNNDTTATPNNTTTNNNHNRHTNPKHGSAGGESGITSTELTIMSNPITIRSTTSSSAVSSGPKPTASPLLSYGTSSNSQNTIQPSSIPIPLPPGDTTPSPTPSTSLPPHLDPRPLPVGWRHVCDPHTGKYYYYNEAALASSWNHPDDVDNNGTQSLW